MISVIIPSYNREKTIKRAMDSVLNQTYRDLELIVVDDASTDQTESIVRAYTDERVRYIRQERNQGACVARNTGIDAAKGEYIAFQDSDDAWRVDKLGKQIKALVENNADVCFCRMERHGYPTNKAVYYPNNVEEGFIDYSKLLLKTYASTQTLLAKAEVFIEHKFDPTCRRMQDYDWMIRAGKDNKVYYVDEVLVDLYLQRDSITSFDYKKTLDAHRFIFDKYNYMFDEYTEFYRTRLDRIAYYRTMVGENATDDYVKVYKSKKSKKALFHLVMSKLGILRAYYKVKDKVWVAD